MRQDESVGSIKYRIHSFACILLVNGGTWYFMLLMSRSTPSSGFQASGPLIGVSFFAFGFLVLFGKFPFPLCRAVQQVTLFKIDTVGVVIR